MYELLKTLMDAMEKVGTVEEVSMKQKTPYLSDRIEIAGKTASGESFGLQLAVGEPAEEDEEGESA